MLDAGEVQIVADITELWATIGGYVRGPDGRYPLRLDDDPALAVAPVKQGGGGGPRRAGKGAARGVKKSPGGAG
ncbi:MAG: hypothetical protein OXM01_09850, partial [Gemmatimonadota bacterium]|nr:hypothetical protein [Gemmatimonadota bacterium]